MSWLAVWPSERIEMIRRLINRLQGNKYGARCAYCGWTAGREDLTKDQAEARYELHQRNTGHYRSASARAYWNIGQQLECLKKED